MISGIWDHLYHSFLVFGLLLFSFHFFSSPNRRVGVWVTVQDGLSGISV